MTTSPFGGKAHHHIRIVDGKASRKHARSAPSLRHMAVYMEGIPLRGTVKNNGARS